MKNIFVGNLPWGIEDQDLEKLFAAYGDVQSAKVITDRDTGRSRGFGFVEMDDDAANEAIENLNGAEVGDREIRVNEANDRPERSSRGGGGGGGGGGRGGYGGGGDGGGRNRW